MELRFDDKNINNGTMATASGSCRRTTVAPQSFWQTESVPGSCHRWIDHLFYLQVSHNHTVTVICTKLYCFAHR